MKEPRVVMLIYANGAFVCTGARSEEMVYEAAETLGKQLDEGGLIRYNRQGPNSL